MFRVYNRFHTFEKEGTSVTNWIEDDLVLDWDTLDGRTLECRVTESEGIKLVILRDPETGNLYVIDAIMSPTIH